MVDIIKRKLQKKEACRKYRLNNREKILKYCKEYYNKNKNKRLEYSKKYNRKNIDKIKAYRKKNKERMYIQQRNSVKRKIIKVAEYKLKNGCKICGYNKCSEALDFHHESPIYKIENISRLRGGNLDRIFKEIKKCILVCRNCHAEIHYEQRKFLTTKE